MWSRVYFVKFEESDKGQMREIEFDEGDLNGMEGVLSKLRPAYFSEINTVAEQISDLEPKQFKVHFTYAGPVGNIEMTKVVDAFTKNDAVSRVRAFLHGYCTKLVDVVSIVELKEPRYTGFHSSEHIEVKKAFHVFPLYNGGYVTPKKIEIGDVAYVYNMDFDERTGIPSWFYLVFEEDDNASMDVSINIEMSADAMHRYFTKDL